MDFLSTTDLTFRIIRNSDFEFVKNYLSNVETTKYLPLERPYSENEANEWLNIRLNHWEMYKFGILILSDNNKVEPIGYCGLEHAKDTSFVDIRYGLTPNTWGKGYAFQAAFATLAYGFITLKLQKIYGAAVPGNSPSISVLAKLGMTPDVTFDVYGDVVIPYSISREDFEGV